MTGGGYKMDRWWFSVRSSNQISHMVVRVLPARPSIRLSFGM